VSTIATQRVPSRRLSTRTIGLAVLAAAGLAAGTALMVQSLTSADETAGRAATSFSVEGANHSRALNVPASSAKTASTSFSLEAVLAARAVNEVEASIDPSIKAIIDGRALNEVGSGTSRLNLEGIHDGRALNAPEQTAGSPSSFLEPIEDVRALNR
jgi:hypothetical protein